jgi:hypothetical protein
MNVQLIANKYEHIGLIDGQIDSIERLTPTNRLGYSRPVWRACIRHGNASWSFIRYYRKRIDGKTVVLTVKVD